MKPYREKQLINHGTDLIGLTWCQSVVSNQQFKKYPHTKTAWTHDLLDNNKFKTTITMMSENVWDYDLNNRVIERCHFNYDNSSCVLVRSSILRIWHVCVFLLVSFPSAKEIQSYVFLFIVYVHFVIMFVWFINQHMSRPWYCDEFMLIIVIY